MSMNKIRNTRINSRVTGRLDEIQTSMNSVVYDFLPIDAVLLFQIRVEPRLNVIHDRLPTIKWKEAR